MFHTAAGLRTAFKLVSNFSHKYIDSTKLILNRRFLKTTYLYLDSAVTQRLPGGGTKFSKKIREKVLSKVAQMDDSKVLEALAPLQAAVKTQVKCYVVT